MIRMSTYMKTYRYEREIRGKSHPTAIFGV